MMDLDLHVMIRWDTDLTDMEIVVTEPSGEVCNSFHNKTKTGMLSRNFTCGYGPQEYCCRTAQPGRYKIEVRLYGAPPAAPPTTVTVRVTTDWGRPVTQVEEYHVVRLNKVKETVHIMDVNFKAL
jgi:Ca-activated chloride channel family protein